MTGKGPLLTLAVGLAVGVVLTTLGAQAANDSTVDVAAGPAAATSPVDVPPSSGTKPSEQPTSTPPEPAPPAAPVNATYAGNVEGTTATIAVAIHDQTVIAYLCDGATVESWLSGTYAAGTLELSSPRTGDTLSGTYADGWVTGTVYAAGQQWTFRVPLVTAPAGLYRATATVAEATVVGGWIRLPDGTVVGTYTVAGGQPAPAPELDFTGLTATVDGVSLTAVPIDGQTGTGF